jgi:hypothetical protein
VRTITILAALLALGVDEALARSQNACRRHVWTFVEPAPARYSDKYVLHPAQKIACDIRYRSSRALPSDEPVWVYGNVCEINLGLGFDRPCE